MKFQLVVVAVVFLCLFFVDAGKYLNEKPTFLHPCTSSDPQFEKCNSENFQVLFTEWKDGIPGLKSVGALDPLVIKRLKISQEGNDLLTMHADVKNMIVKGASQTKVKSAQIKSDSFEVTVFMPILRYEMDFRVKGRVFSLPLSGEGKGYFETENSEATLSGTMKFRKVNDITFMDMQTIKIHFDKVEKFKLKLHNLFGGQAELEDAANALLNDNWRDLFEIMRPVLQQTSEAIFKDRFLKIFSYVPANYFLKDL